eukprot:366013-Chlamydomonas_euryale.AAC.11
MPRLAEIDVELWPAPNGSYSDSPRLVKPDSPPVARSVCMRPRRPVRILFHYVVQRDRQLNHAEAGAQVAAGARDRVDDVLAKLLAQLLELLRVEVLLVDVRVRTFASALVHVRTRQWRVGRYRCATCAGVGCVTHFDSLEMRLSQDLLLRQNSVRIVVLVSSFLGGIQDHANTCQHLGRGAPEDACEDALKDALENTLAPRLCM